jgi:hypothetical protein
VLVENPAVVQDALSVWIYLLIAILLSCRMTPACSICCPSSEQLLPINSKGSRRACLMQKFSKVSALVYLISKVTVSYLF